LPIFYNIIKAFKTIIMQKAVAKTGCLI